MSYQYTSSLICSDQVLDLEKLRIEGSDAFRPRFEMDVCSDIGRLIGWDRFSSGIRETRIPRLI